MSTKHLFVCLCLLFSVAQVQAIAQTSPTIKVDLAKNTITINNVVFTQHSTIQEYEKHLGIADRILQKRGIDQYFAYDQLGISLSLQRDSDVVNEVVITYLNDGDGKVAKEAYKGTLLVNSLELKPKISPKEASRLLKLNLEEVMNGFFLTPMRPLNLLLYYPDDAPYTRLKQFGIRFANNM